MARQLLEMGASLPNNGAVPLLPALLKATHFECVELVLQSRFARSLLYKDAIDHEPAIQQVLDLLGHFPRHEGILARLGGLIGGNSYFGRMLATFHCKCAVVALYGVLRERFTIASASWNESGKRQQRIPLDMVRLLSRILWDTRSSFRWVDGFATAVQNGKTRKTE